MVKTSCKGQIKLLAALQSDNILKYYIAHVYVVLRRHEDGGRGLDLEEQKEVPAHEPNRAIKIKHKSTNS